MINRTKNFESYYKGVKKNKTIYQLFFKNYPSQSNYKETSENPPAAVNCTIY